MATTRYTIAGTPGLTTVTAQVRANGASVGSPVAATETGTNSGFYEVVISQPPPFSLLWDDGLGNRETQDVGAGNYYTAAGNQGSVFVTDEATPRVVQPTTLPAPDAVEVSSETIEVSGS